jgi:uncharacterized protein YqgV (UPF0045/DUF77 family)
MWSVGMIKGSNELGFSMEQVKELDPIQLNEKMKSLTTNFTNPELTLLFVKWSELIGMVKRINQIVNAGNISRTTK